MHRSTVLTRLMIMIGSASSGALWAVETAPSRSDAPTVNVGVEVGYKAFDLRWVSGGAPGNPPFASNWSQERALATAIRVSNRADSIYALDARFEYDVVYDGANRHSGFSDDGGTEVYRSENSADGGYLWCNTFDAGVHLWSDNGRLLLTPQLGWISATQHLVQRDGDQVLPATGPYSGLASSYTARWQGPRLSVGGAWQCLPTLVLSGRIGYAWTAYNGAADWNLRSDLEHPLSLTQRGEAQGIDLGVALDWHQTPRLGWHAALAFEHWRTVGGTDRIHDATGEDQVTSLDEVRLRSLLLSLGTQWRF